MKEFFEKMRNREARKFSFALFGGKLAVAGLCFVVMFALYLGSTSQARAQAASATPVPQAPDSTASAIAGGNSGSAIDLAWPAPADPKNATKGEVINNVAHNKISINVVWTLVAGFLIMFMQAGFALVETGLCRAKNAAHVMATNFMIYGLGMLGFWICGFALMFGGVGVAAGAIGSQPALGQGITLLSGEYTLHFFGGKAFGLFGTKGFFMGSNVFDTAIFTLFLFEMVFMDMTATIPTGAMAERWSFRNFFIYGFWVGMVGYTLFGNWVWGGGWLAQLGANFGLGHGHVDFAGSSVVHQCGGMIALAGAVVLGPRLGKFGRNGKARPIPAHDLPMVMLGTFILAFGWFGLNSGSTLAGADSRIAIIAVNTALASAAGAVVATLIMWIFFGKPDPTMMCNGMLAGLVAITAPCAFVTSLGAVLLGGISGALVVASVVFVERVLKIDDPVGAISVHGTCGSWGVVSLGLFANGSYGQGWNGVHKLFKDGQILSLVNDGSAKVAAQFAELTGAGPKGGWVDQGVTGALGKFFGASYNDWSQLGAELTGTLTCLIFVGAFAWVWFRISNGIFPIRSMREDEISGLDIPEMGAQAYPDFQLTDKSSPPVD